MVTSGKVETPQRQHGRASFFKYTTADTAMRVLDATRIRWSSPLLFNDPFDVPRDIFGGTEPKQLAQAVSQKLIELIDHPPDEFSGLNPLLQAILGAARRGIPPEIKRILFEDLKSFVDEYESEGALEEMRENWHAALADLRILCLTESPFHLAMWYHYADAYRGAVIELRCSRESDSAWLAAQQVRYPEQKPDIYSPSGWASLLFSPQHQAQRVMLDLATQTKAPDWSYEREWRVVTARTEKESGLYSDYEFAREDLAALYIGPMALPETRSALRRLLAKYPNADLYQAELDVSRELRFCAEERI